MVADTQIMNQIKFSSVPEYVKALSSPPINYSGPAAADAPEVSIISAFYNPQEYF